MPNFNHTEMLSTFKRIWDLSLCETFKYIFYNYICSAQKPSPNREVLDGYLNSS